MPGGDRTGPWGQGAGTGGGRGGCVPFGRGLRAGRGVGRGRGSWFGRALGAVSNVFAPSNAADEVAELKAERDMIDARLAEIEKEKK